jgi:hypothetical protein
MRRIRPAHAAAPCLVWGALALASAPASAQSAADVTTAEKLYAQGSALVDGGRYEEGCPKLDSAQKLVMGIGVTLYVGACHEHRGELLRAWEQFKKAEDLAAARGDPRRSVARGRADRLWPRLAKIEIVAPVAAEAAGLVLAVDDVTVPRSAWGTERPVDAGVHRIRASAPDREPWQVATDVQPGPAVAVSVPPLKMLAAPSASPPPSAPPAPGHAAPVADSHVPSVGSAPAPLTPQRVAAFAVLGVSAVGFGVALAFGISAKVKMDDSNSSGHCLPNDHCDATGLAERSSALTDAGISTGTFIAGAACLAGGVALYLSAPRRETTVVLIPRAETVGASVLLESRW